MAPPKIQFVGASCGKHGTHTFYKAFKYFNEEKCRILTLGEFFFLKINDNSPVCIGELQLLWENQSNTELLCSIRLYFLPENTPEGKQEYHGEDEILSISEKLVLKLEDLVTLIIDHVEWTAGREPYHDDGTCESRKRESPKMFPSTNCQFSLSDVQKEKEFIGDTDDSTSTNVIILSFPQYCRYRAVLKRLENVADKWLKNAIVRAIGGITSPHENSRILFCRDTFDHPDIDDFELRCDHLAPNLKGRPRKKRSTTQDSNQDSDETSSEISVQTLPTKVKIGKRVSALRNGYRFDKDQVSKDEQSFLFSLHKFMKKRNTPINRIPSLGFQQIDLYAFYTYSQKLGGYEQICAKRLWKHLYDKLGGDPSSTSAATCTRRHYEKLLWAYEKHMKGESANSCHSLKGKRAKLLSKPKEETYKQLKPGKRNAEKENNRFINRHDGIIRKKRKFKDRPFINLHEKVKKWEQLRKLKAVERDKMKKSASHPKTVKNLLDNYSQKEDSSPVEKVEKTDVKLPKESKESKVPQNIEKPKLKTDVKVEKISVDAKPAISVLQSHSDHLNGDTKVKKKDKVQSEPSAKTPDQKHVPIPPPGFLPINSSLPFIGAHPAAMFYPPAFIPMGAVSPLGLPVMHHLPLTLPPFMPQSPTDSKNSLHQKSSKAAAHQIPSPSSHNKSGNKSSVIQQAQVSMATTSKHSDQKSHPSVPKSPSLSSTSSSVSPIQCLMTPPAHMNGLKRPYSASPMSHIPSPYRPPFSNKSLLFDFESPKRPKVESSSDSNKSVSDSSQDNDQPTDLSMKTLRKLESFVKKETKKMNGNAKEAVDLRCFSPYVPSDSPQDLSKKLMGNSVRSIPSSKSSVSSHNSLSKTDSPSSVFTKSKPSVFIPTSPGHSKDSKSQVPVSASSKGESKRDGCLKIPQSPFKADSSGIVHPAFPHFVPPYPVPPQSPGFVPTPQQMQQIYQAQIRANAAHAHAFEEMMQRNRGSVYPTMPLSMFVPQPVYAHTHKDKAREHAK